VAVLASAMLAHPVPLDAGKNFWVMGRLYNPARASRRIVVAALASAMLDVKYDAHRLSISGFA
jgi:hypothetical protein